MEERYLRTAALIGEAALEKLKNSTVAVFGIGGVGSYAAEALARSGIGTLYLYDNDTVSESNRNRQLVALGSTVGRLKTEVAAERIRDIDPDVRVVERPEFVNPESDIPFEKLDYIIDAVDNVTAKLFLIQNAMQRGVPIISVMGTGNKLDPSRLQVSDIFDTYECPLAKVMRSELKKRGIKKLEVVWSPERPLKSAETEEKRVNGRPTPASMTFVPASAGIMAAARAVKVLINK